MRRAAVARELRLAFQELGPAWIKLGQLISVRPDVFPAEWVFEMELLRDSVQPLPAEAIRRVIRADFGREPEELFATFDDEPLASASIAQVHRATLAEEYRPVVGDVLAGGHARSRSRSCAREPSARSLPTSPSARPLVERLARIGSARRMNLPALLEEFATSLASECDLRNEARVADRFAFDFSATRSCSCRASCGRERLGGCWRWSTSRAGGSRDIDDAARAGIDGRALAEHGAEVFMRGVLVLGRYHADLHPANVFVTPDGRICYLDFGIVGDDGAGAARRDRAGARGHRVRRCRPRAQVLGRARPGRAARRPGGGAGAGRRADGRDARRAAA